MAQIQFSRGVSETVVPNISLTRGKSGNTGTATFLFESPNIFDAQSTDEVTGMYLVDEEGEITTNEVKGIFVNRKPTSIKAILIMNSQDEWDRFMRFMERYGQENGLEFSKA